MNEGSVHVLPGVPMRVFWKLYCGLAVVALLTTGCDHGPSAPAFTLPRIAASYVLIPGPGGTVDSVGCGLYEAYEFSIHFLAPDDDSNKVGFFASGAARPRCGDLDFAQTTAPASDTAHFSYVLTYPGGAPGQWEWWIRRMRRDFAPYSFVQLTMALDSIPLNVRHDTGFSAPTMLGFDLTAFAFRHRSAVADLVPAGYDSATIFDGEDVDAAAHLWGKFLPPTGLTPSLIGPNQPRVNWINHHPGRTIDSTEVFRNANGAGWQFRASVSGLLTQFTDTQLPAGTYGYFVRHVTSRTFPNAAEPRLARPNSPTTDSVGVAINPLQAPSGLTCTSATSTTVSCTWTNGAPAESVVVERQSGSNWLQVAVRPPGTVQHTNTGLHAAVTYSHRVRHSRGPLVSLPSAAANATTPIPEAPVALYCVGHWWPGITCTWSNSVPTDSTLVRRDGVVRARLGPGVSVWTDDPVTQYSTYVYQVQHKDLTVSGLLSAPDTTTANQPGPDNLSCGRTGATTATCVWVNTDPGNDTIEVFRKSNKWLSTPHAVLVGTAIQFDDTGLSPGVAYTYRLRYKFGSLFSLWSNEDGVGTTWPEPYGPLGGP